MMMNFVLASGAAVLAWSMMQHNKQTKHVSDHSEKQSLFQTTIGPWWEHSNENLSVPGGTHAETHKQMQKRHERISADHPATSIAHRAVTGTESTQLKVDTLNPNLQTVYM